MIKEKIKRIVKQLNAKEKIAIPHVIYNDRILEGKTALIIGGSGGIGIEIGKKFVSAGANVIITATSMNKLEYALQKISSDKVRGIILDLSHIDLFYNKILEAEGCFNEYISILVNCAGHNEKNDFWEITESDYDYTMNVNVKGVFFMCQQVAKYMIERNIKGHILNLSSSSAMRPAKTPYEISKWAIKGFTLGLADSLLQYGIVVNAVAPGPTATPMLCVDPNGDITRAKSPTGRYALPEEIANIAVFLVSEAGNLIIGDTIYATGGSGIIYSHR